MTKKIAIALGLTALAWYLFRKTKEENYLIDTVGVERGGFMKVANVVKSAVNSIAGGHDDNQQLTPSTRVIALMKDYEKFHKMSYFATDDERKRGLKTIGYGHLILKGEVFQEPMTIAQANTLFLKDLNSHTAQIYKEIKVKLNQHQFDALAHFCYNTGRSALGTYWGLTNFINAGDFDNAANKFMEYTKQSGVFLQGLYNRRYTEMQMFKWGIYERFNG